MVLLLHGLGVGLLPLAFADFAKAEPLPKAPAIPLECRLEQGPWQPCQMQVIDVGRHWLVRIGEQRYRFRHDGTGQVQREDKGRWVEVGTEWAADQSLCWGSLCVRGDLPLD